jgi:hypothetical protein
VAVVGFLVALCLKQVPLRNSSSSNSRDMGEGFAMPTTESPEQVLENAVGRLLRGNSGVQLRSLAASPGSELDVARLWALLQVYRFAQAAGQARLGDVAEHVRVPREILEPSFDRLVVTGYAQRNGDRFWLTPAGARQVDFLRTGMVDWLTRRLVESPAIDGRPGRDEVQSALERIAQNVLVQRDWTDDTTQPIRTRFPNGWPNVPTRPFRARPPRPPAPQSMRPTRVGPRASTEPPTTRLRPANPPPAPRRYPR